MAGLHCPEDPCMVYLLKYINHTNQLYVGEYTIHGSYGSVVG